MKLFYTKRSPYARKVLIIAHEKGIAGRMDLVEVDLSNKTDELFRANPLGKVPALQLDDGRVLFDSPVICEYLDGVEPESEFFPQGDERFDVLTVTALADGIIDSAVAMVLEGMRPEEKRFDKAVAKHKRDIIRAVEALEKEHKKFAKMNIAAVTTASALGYLSFRHPSLNWRAGKSRLADWFDEFSQRESMKSTMPG